MSTNAEPSAAGAIQDVSERALHDLLSLRDRVAVVTGGAQGIGFAAARRLTEAGATVILADRNETGATAAAKTLSGPGGAASARVLDVTDAQQIRDTADAVVAEHGRLDIWINNAGIFPSTPLLDVTDEEWDAVLAVNLRGMFLGAREAGRRMRDLGNGGVIVNLASTSAHAGFGPGFAPYTSSKHGLLGLTKALAIELGPYGIRVVAISPQLTLTEGITGAAEDFESSGLGAILDGLAARTPLGRVGVPDDIARAILFAVSDLATFVSGSNITVDGGLLAVG
jgi:NAD(P)-dependent dehydrogenase (short-subunit alcohol dehydrogenase family)